MRRSIWISFSLLVFSSLGLAQEAQPSGVLRYLFFAPGAVSYPGDPAFTYQVKDREGNIREYTIPGTKGERHTTFHLGGGVDFVIYKGVGVGAAIGALGASGGAFALADVNPSYHFTSLGRSRKWVPFVTGGYTRAGGREWGENWFNFGGGLDYWLRSTKALRLEVRDHVDPQHKEAMIHYLEYRVGLVW